MRISQSAKQPSIRIGCFTGTILLALLCLAQSRASAQLPVQASKLSCELKADAEDTVWSKEKRMRWLNTAAIGGLAAYGLMFWDYGDNDFQFVQEGWFGADTPHGGVDKLGHAYSSYTMVNACGALYEHWGYEHDSASWRAAVSSFSFFTLMEVGDALSQNGFSKEDMAFDAAGTLLGYLRRQYPGLRRRLDYRVQYWPSKSVRSDGFRDIAQDYAGYKYLLAFKLGGFDRLESSPLRFLELHAGYSALGFESHDKEYYDRESRHWYVGIGLSLSTIVRERGLTRTSSFLNYYQPPFTYVASDHELGD